MYHRTSGYSDFRRTKPTREPSRISPASRTDIFPNGVHPTSMERDLSRELQRLRLDATSTDAQADGGNIADKEPTPAALGPDDGICPEAELSVPSHCPHRPPPCRSSVCYMERMVQMHSESYRHTWFPESYRHRWRGNIMEMRRADYGTTRSPLERRRGARCNVLERQPSQSES